MGSNGFTGSQRLIDLAQQLRLYKPLPPTADDQTVAAPQSYFHAELMTVKNPIPNESERSKKPNRAAVLICLFEGEKEGELRVILTKRSSRLSTHSGEVALPGGKVEEGDADDIQTALREAEEEIGLDPSLVEVVAVLEPFINKIGITVVPVIGLLSDKKAFQPTPSAAEVEAIFDAPLEMFLRDENRRAEELEWEGNKYLLHFFDYETDNKKYVIWALTAGILIRAASLVYQKPPAFPECRPKFWSRNQQCRY